MKPAMVTLALILIGFLAGIAVGHYKLFPFNLLLSAKNSVGLDLGADARRDAAKQPRLSLFEEFQQQADIVFVGDSLTQAGLWNEFFETPRIANRGIGSDKTTDVLARLDTVIATRPDTAFLMIGINDITNGRSPAEIAETYASIVDQLKAARIEVVIQSTVQCDPSQGRCTAVHVQAVNALNDLLVELADEKQVRFLKLGELANPQGLSPEYTYDGMHLTAAGYRAWIDAVQDALTREQQ